MSEKIVTGLPMVDPDRVDSFPWTSTTTRAELDADGVAYLLLETMDGQPIAWAPLGSPKPLAHGEGIRWQIRLVNG